MEHKKITVSNFSEFKQNNRKITMLTAYDYPTAKILDKAGVDAILVGDSLGMVVLGYEDTTKVTMEDMLHHIKAVSRGSKRALIVGDMPFLSYRISQSECLRNAGRLISEGGCTAVKLEGGAEVVGNVKTIVQSGIPVMGHIGYTPQSIHSFGGHKSQGKTFDTAKKIIEDAMLLQEAGVFAIVLECAPHKLAEYLSKKVSVPIIGIGSGVKCDGQVLVISDIIGFAGGFVPRHAKKYSDIENVVYETAKMYINEVQNEIFPTESNSFTILQEVLDKIYEEI